MEQTLYIAQLYESIDRGIRQHDMAIHTLKVADLAEGSQWLIDECEGQESYDDPNKVIRLKWVLTVNRLILRHRRRRQERIPTTQGTR